MNILGPHPCLFFFEEKKVSVCWCVCVCLLIVHEDVFVHHAIGMYLDPHR